MRPVSNVVLLIKHNFCREFLLSRTLSYRLSTEKGSCVIIKFDSFGFMKTTFEQKNFQFLYDLQYVIVF